MSFFFCLLQQYSSKTTNKRSFYSHNEPHSYSDWNVALFYLIYRSSLHAQNRTLFN